MQPVRYRIILSDQTLVPYGEGRPWVEKVLWDFEEAYKISTRLALTYVVTLESSCTETGIVLTRETFRNADQ